MYKIAVVEDEKDLLNVIVAYLNKEGYDVTTFSTGEEAILHSKDKFHLWVLDIMLPGTVNGFELIKEIKKYNENVPVIFTSARDADIDKIMGLELGSDDYLSKPYSQRELILRIQRILNRCYNSQIDDKEDNILKYGPYIIDFDKRIVFDKNEPILLTSKEFDLLTYLINNKNVALGREQILDKVWGEDYYGSDRVVDDLLRRLRSKLHELKIETLYGFGYRLIW